VDAPLDEAVRGRMEAELAGRFVERFSRQPLARRGETILSLMDRCGLDIGAIAGTLFVRLAPSEKAGVLGMLADQPGR